MRLKGGIVMIKKVSNGNEKLEKVVKKIVNISREEELQGIYDKELQDEWIRDRYKEEGLLGGRKEGKEQGIKEGRIQKQIEIAKNLLKQNINLQIVHTATGLSLEELERLNDEN